MVIVTSGLDMEGKPCEFYLDQNLKENLDEIKEVVGTNGKEGNDWDEIALVAGYPGTGKSNFAMSMAKYCCPDFNEKDIAFDAEDFIDFTNKAKPNSSIILDESFQSLNSKTTMTTDFVRIINHLQLVRQKNLYIFLCIPNFFDLAKSIAIYRSAHLFTCYSPKYGQRGSFAAFGREEKKNLYIAGQKFMNYNAVNPNFRGRFVKAKGIDMEAYLKRKREHLLKQGQINIKETKQQKTRDNLVYNLYTQEKMIAEKIALFSGLDLSSIYAIVRKKEQQLMV
jgi:hypothetical protein